ncbi:MAG TPA: AAA family ATPase [Solirubrobacteraceae bacterium]|nr:AAA family ATPase [Solirubrobacteraceae bacterium]
MSPATIETVSVLITDLVGSTAMAERLGKAAAEELRAEHFALLRGALKRTGGREVKNLGDGLMMVFDSATQSLSCAVELQQAIDARNRRAEEPLGLRIGMSLGDATVKEGDYFGWPAIEATRLCAEAKGGQIVVNALVRQVAGARAEHRFHSLGALELRGIAEPLQAFELVWEPILAAGIELPKRLRELSATAYVGRVTQGERLRQLWAQARGGSLRLVLIGGEAGVGKTRLATHLAIEVHGGGATVLYGRCDEDLGVPYQPWAQAIGHFVKEAPRLILERHLERHGGDLARLVPVLHDRVSDLPSPRESDPETERYLLYAAVAGLLQEAGQQKPLMLILDDLHWADQPTLSLLRHVAGAGSSMRVLVVGAYRDSELSQDHPLASLLADLHREQGVERLKLTGLHSEEVLALMEAAAGHELDEDGRALARKITFETAGNPFFAVELLRYLTESRAVVQGEGGRWRLVGDLSELGLPESLREVIGRRVGRLGSDAHRALSAAAVIGSDFDLELLLAVLEVPEAYLLDLLEKAVTSSLLQENRDRAGRFAFTHALVGHALYEDLGATGRARLHRRVAEALEEQCGEEPSERLGELAAHWTAAVVSSDIARALRYTRRAAEHALAKLAPDEAARWYRDALQLNDQATDGDRPERCELLIGLGEAQRQTGDPDFRQTLLDAAELAQGLGDTDRLASAVLANTRGVASHAGAVDGERVQTLEAAAQALPSIDPRRGQVLALLASELHYSGEPSRCRQLAAEAIELARAGGDEVVLAHTLCHVTWAIYVPDTLDLRKRLIDELVDLTERLDDPWLSCIAALRQLNVSFEAGDRVQMESGLVAMRALAASVPQPTIQWLWSLYESARFLMQGDLHQAEQWANRAAEAGTAAGQPDALMIFGAQVSQVRYFQGRLGELVEQTGALAGDPENLATWRAAAALAMMQSGRKDEARELALAEDLKRVPWDQVWGVTMVSWGLVCSRLGLVDRAGELYEMLAPFSGQFAFTGANFSGPFDAALGILAATLERYEEAECHFAAGAEQSADAPLFLANTRLEWARALIARGRPEDVERAMAMLDQAHDTATRLFADGLTRAVEKSRGAMTVT